MYNFKCTVSEVSKSDETVILLIDDNDCECLVVPEEKRSLWPHYWLASPHDKASTMQLCNSSSGSCQLEEIYPRSLSSSSSSFYHLLITDEGPETGDESDEDIVRSYLPGEGLGGGYLGDNNHNIPAINITLHSPSTNHVLGESPVSQSSEALKCVHQSQCL